MKTRTFLTLAALASLALVANAQTTPAKKPTTKPPMKTSGKTKKSTPVKGTKGKTVSHATHAKKPVATPPKKGG